MTSNAPPTVSPASFARVDGGDHARLSDSSSTQRSGASSGSALASSNVTETRIVERRRRQWRRRGWPCGCRTRASSCRARPPAATRAAVSRALARSSTSRMSSWPYFSAPGEVGVTRPRPRDGRRARRPLRSPRRLGVDVHRLLPVDPVAVADQQRDRRAGGLAAPDAGENLRAVALDRHPAAAPVAALTPPELGGERVEVERRPAGMPSRMTTSAWPCDSPAVRNRSMSGSFYTKFLPRPGAPHELNRRKRAIFPRSLGARRTGRLLALRLHGARAAPRIASLRRSIRPARWCPRRARQHAGRIRGERRRPPPRSRNGTSRLHQAHAGRRCPRPN